MSLDMFPDSFIKLLLEMTQEERDALSPPASEPDDSVDDGTSYGGNRDTGGWAV